MYYLFGKKAFQKRVTETDSSCEDLPFDTPLIDCELSKADAFNCLS